mmetsp:Transcript_52365/g.150090  ORF Transcript_52365/g.150090 Transcript_52365/m.150090 type:complete len:237 (-) Transcript_52365:47-757(-)
MLQCSSCHHATFECRMQAADEALPQCRGAEGVKLREHSRDLLVARVREFDVHVGSPVADQRRIQALPVVCGQNEDLTICLADTIESVQKSRECEGRVLDELLAVSAENRIDVLEDQDRFLGRLVDSGPERVVGQIRVGQVHVADVVLKVGRQSLNQGGLAGSRDSIEEVPPLMLDPMLFVPLPGIWPHEFLHVRQQLIFRVLLQHDRVQRPCRTDDARLPELVQRLPLEYAHETRL